MSQSSLDLGQRPALTLYGDKDPVGTQSSLRLMRKAHGVDEDKFWLLPQVVYARQMSTHKDVIGAPFDPITLPFLVPLSLPREPTADAPQHLPH